MIADRIHDHLLLIGETIGERPTGSEPNRSVQEYIRRILEEHCSSVWLQPFDCREWMVSNASCQCAGIPVPIVPNPYSPSCRISSPVVIAGSIPELKNADITGKIILLHGDLTRYPLTPKGFTFYNPVEHQEIIRLLEEKQPAAVITETDRSDYAVPVIIDGDFLLPSCTVTRVTGTILRSTPAYPVSLDLTTTNRQVQAANVIGRIGRGSESKIVLCAHFDTKYGTPGALDNAAGVTALLALASRFCDNPPDITLEFVFFNGEECYSIPGEMAYFDTVPGDSGEISLAINIDGIGLAGKGSSIAYFECPDSVIRTTEAVRSRYDHLVRVDPWPQGDHSLFSMRGIPCMALTSDAGWDEIDSIIHTPSDTLDRLDESVIWQTVLAVEEIIRALTRPDEMI